MAVRFWDGACSRSTRAGRYGRVGHTLPPSRMNRGAVLGEPHAGRDRQPGQHYLDPVAVGHHHVGGIDTGTAGTGRCCSSSGEADVTGSDIPRSSERLRAAAARTARGVDIPQGAYPRTGPTTRAPAPVLALFIDVAAGKTRRRPVRSR